MPDTESPAEGLRPFFEQFQTLNAAGDVDGLVGLYASTVTIVGPAGSHVVKASDLLAAIPRRKRLFADAGHRTTALVGFAETSLTPRYSFVRTDWQWVFEQAGRDRTTVTLPASFVVDRSGDSPHIVVYIPHDDVNAVLKERGLLS